MSPAGTGPSTGSTVGPGGDEPAWLGPWRRAVEAGQRLPDGWRGTPPGDGQVRRAAVLVLLGESTPAPAGGTTALPGPVAPTVAMPGAAGGLDYDVLLTRRSDSLASHPGQVAFPGGRRDPEDADDAVTALREAREEVGVDPDDVQVVGLLPPLWVPPSSHQVVPVVGWWHRPGPVGVVDPFEVAQVVRVPVTELVDPANRVGVRYPAGRGNGPGFLVGGLFVWGFTAGLLSWLLELAGLERPWDSTPVVDHEGSPLSGADLP